MQSDFCIPKDPRISEGCREVLTGLLHHDQKQRMSIGPGMEPSWFLHSLPAGGDSLNTACLEIAHQVSLTEFAFSLKPHFYLFTLS